MTRHWPAGLLAGFVVIGAAIALPATAQNESKAATPDASKPTAQDESKKTASDAPKPTKEDEPKATASDAPKAKAQDESSAAASDASKPQDNPDAGAQTTDDGDAAQASGRFDYDRVVEQAEALAKKPYSEPSKIPQFLQDFDFAALDQIKYKPDSALWHERQLPFEAMFYHPGSYYVHPVKMHLVTDDGVGEFRFDKNRFEYPNEDLRKRIPDDLGYAGLKFMHELDTPGKLDEIVSFLGASYFRALGAEQHYGLSARGLAIDTGSDKGEEFPAFVSFWLVRPRPQARTVTAYALLDSPSAAGAYKFEINPGDSTVTRVEATLFTRKAIGKLGVAPLTSMYMWGENSLARLDDYRPEAHDSDGLLISATNGEWLWRPLRNPQKLSMNQFSADNVRGFGLLQRDRNFDHYQDLDYEYEKRPNAWITPEGDWGKGHLELVQIPSDSEVNDNIALYWVPDDPVEAGARLHYAYSIRWGKELASPASLAHTTASRIGRAAVTPGQPRNTLQVAIEFEGGELGKLTDPASVQPRVNAMRDATINNIEAVRNPHTGGWRLTFLVPTDSLKQPLELRAYLAGADGGALTETWSYALSP
ncbi:glucan biosynthesis protein [Salinisphaera sp.]|uniref:glucan biosynthesis protein n=1 Tax=Salinisphaera sp. TaxID=1914330 RepID=UPI000C4B6047|nr:glucan biosynthesis protein [Salinisphaera sp.]MBS63631.1 glucan biosynthesis protein D [Salinisphaera sp.]